jgi:hypothetical protein
MMSPDPSMEALVGDALACVAAECPLAFRAVQAALGGRRVDLSVGRESFALALAESSEAPSGVVRIRTTSRVLRDVLTGERDPLEAVLADDLVVHGGAGDLVAAAEAGLFFAKGAARCTSMDRLLSRLSQLVEEEG